MSDKKTKFKYQEINFENEAKVAKEKKMRELSVHKDFYKKHIKDELKKVVCKPHNIRFSPFYLEKTARMQHYS